MDAELVDLLPRLRRMARALCRDEEEADELVQRAVERALANRHRFRPGTRLDSWMHRIMQNLWLDDCRRRRRRGPTVELETVHHLPGSDGRRDGEMRLTLGRVREAIRALPEGSASRWCWCASRGCRTARRPRAWGYRSGLS